eukprot:2129870-Rhodomonas_salina.1
MIRAIPSRSLCCAVILFLEVSCSLLGQSSRNVTRLLSPSKSVVIDAKASASLEHAMQKCNGSCTSSQSPALNRSAAQEISNNKSNTRSSMSFRPSDYASLANHEHQHRRRALLEYTGPPAD